MKRRSPFWHVGLILTAAICALGVFNYERPWPGATANATSLSAYIGTPTVAWPTIGEAALGASGDGVLAATTAQSKMPTASLAKVLTALTVLKAKPLELGEDGPNITMTAADVALYNKYVGEDGSVVRVVAGEQLSEYQALEAMLLPSANNIADSLAVWAFGSMDAYRAAAANVAAGLDLNNTVVGSDASGFLPDTQSTPSDLVRLGEAALQNSVIAHIAGQRSAVLPIVGTVANANSDVGIDGIIGLKVGNNDQDPGAILFAAPFALGGGQSVTIVGAIMGQPSLQSALAAAPALLKSAEAGFTVETPVTAGQVLATYLTADNKSVTAVAQGTLSIAAWQGDAPLPHLSLNGAHASLPTGAVVGTATINAGTTTVSTPIVLSAAIPAPTFWQRVLRF